MAWIVKLIDTTGVMGSDSWEVSAQVADALPEVLNRPDAGDALDYVNNTPIGGPSCGCGGDHWSCDE